MARGQVVKLDRGYPLVQLEDGTRVRCEHATGMVKGSDVRAVIGDEVEVALPDGHAVGIIEAVASRRCELVRKDPTDRAQAQVLAANFDRVVIVQALGEVNLRRLERELVLAAETGASVDVVLTKADQAEGRDEVARVSRAVQALVGDACSVLVVAAGDAASLEPVRALLAPGTTTILLGRSGVGKSTLVNSLMGATVQATGSVRATDGKGRHTTVSREVVALPNGARIVDMPGVRGLGLWEADAGIGAAFADVEELAQGCRFRDCTHGAEPGCAVRASVESGALAPERYESDRALKQETADSRERREQARWQQSDRRRGKKR